MTKQTQTQFQTPCRRPGGAALAFLVGGGMALMLSGCAKSPSLVSPPASIPAMPAPAPAPKPEGEPAELTVFAAASLTEAFNEMAEGFQKEHPNVKIIKNYAGSQTLRTQLEQGAQADLFASADMKNMEAVARLTQPPQVFARNVVTVILSKRKGTAVKTFSDLAQPGLRIVAATEGCPIGDYTREVLSKLEASGKYGPHFKQQVLGNVVSNETNVKQVLAKVALGEADAGFVYATDVTDDVGELAIPDEYNLQAGYPLAILKASPHPEVAQEYVAWILSGKGQAILQKQGFRGAN